jgi:hypothetical protein
MDCFACRTEDAMPVVIPLAAAAVGAAGSAYASSQARRGQQAAANASQTATDQATAEQRRQYDLSRADNAPWLNAGRGALSQLAGLYGISTGATPPGTITQPQVGTLPATGGAGGNPSIFQPGGSIFGRTNRIIDVGYGQTNEQQAQMMPAIPGAENPDAPQVNGGQPVPQVGTAPATTQPGVGTTGPGGTNSPFWASPDYQFRLNEQNRALTARNAALGIQDSGAAQRSALQLSGNLASGEYNNYANRLASLAGVGQTAAAQNQNLGQNYAGAVGNLLTNNAQNLASSYQNIGAINGQFGQSLAGTASNFINRYPWGR